MRWGWFALLCAFAAPGLSACLGDAGSEVRSVLNRWEQASSGLLGVGPMEHRRLYEFHHAAYSAHEISVLNEFRGPISAGDLTRRFEWSLEKAGEELLLAGKPTDDVERLFYKRFLVSIDPKTHLPQTVQFEGRNPTETRDPLAVVLSPRTEEPNLFLPAPSARPLKYVSRDEKTPRLHSPVRIVEHTAKAPAGRDLPPEVRNALRNWESSARETLSLEANIRRFTYEAGTHVEQRAVGELSYASEPVVRCTLRPAPIDPAERSHRRTADGGAYDLMPAPAESWHYTPSEIRFFHRPGEPAFVLHHTAGRAVRAVSHELAPIDLREHVIPPWDLLFRVSATSLAERFHVRLCENEHLMTWSFIPRQPGDVGGFREMRVLVETTTWLPTAVQLLNPGGDVETVYTFHYTQVRRQKPAGAEPALLPIEPDPQPLLPAREVYPEP